VEFGVVCVVNGYSCLFRHPFMGCPYHEGKTATRIGWKI